MAQSESAVIHVNSQNVCCWRKCVKLEWLPVDIMCFAMCKGSHLVRHSQGESLKGCLKCEQHCKSGSLKYWSSTLWLCCISGCTLVLSWYIQRHHKWSSDISPDSVLLPEPCLFWDGHGPHLARSGPNPFEINLSNYPSQPKDNNTVKPDDSRHCYWIRHELVLIRRLSGHHSSQNKLLSDTNQNSTNSDSSQLWKEAEPAVAQVRTRSVQDSTLDRVKKWADPLHRQD